uniref:3-hydroxyisobutyryl-CoA hydrolase n=1 Tax=Vitis vinifera TaxID=29760 RepID=F6I1H0_VITVI
MYEPYSAVFGGERDFFSSTPSSGCDRALVVGDVFGLDVAAEGASNQAPLRAVLSDGNPWVMDSEGEKAIVDKPEAVEEMQDREDSSSIWDESNLLKFSKALGFAAEGVEGEILKLLLRLKTRRDQGKKKGSLGLTRFDREVKKLEWSVFAMPETALGLFPDVGASYFLSRLPGFFGEYVGLTGARLDGAEMLACGLATHFVPSTRLLLLEAALCKLDSGAPATISSILDEYSQQPHLKENSAYHKLAVINKCFSRRTIEEILSTLEREAVNSADNWISATIQSLQKASPTSLKISLRSIREGRLQDVGQCLTREYRMVCHVLQGEVSKDFFEGCRAILLDKDKNPKWEPSRLEQINESMVEQYFSKVDDEEWEDLKLPAKFTFSASLLAKL